MSKSFLHQTFKRRKLDYTSFWKLERLTKNRLSRFNTFVLFCIMYATNYLIYLLERTAVVEQNPLGINKLVSICNPIHPLFTKHILYNVHKREVNYGLKYNLTQLIPFFIWISLLLSCVHSFQKPKAISTHPYTQISIHFFKIQAKPMKMMIKWKYRKHNRSFIQYLQFSEKYEVHLKVVSDHNQLKMRWIWYKMLVTWNLIYWHSPAIISMKSNTRIWNKNILC